jgi:phosphoribosylaminoimidazolecarboxamide formyltransferase/IMP cyclohydrolase
MLRSAAKNFQDVIVLTDPEDYAEVTEGIRGGRGPEALTPALKRRLAGKVFDLTAAYDAAIARYLLGTGSQEAGTKTASAAFVEYPSYWPMSLKKAQSLRYGENGHQTAALYLKTDRPGALSAMEQIHGKELSYNNIRDLDLAWKAACAFGLPIADCPPIGEDDVKRLVPGVSASLSQVCCAVVKHNTPCGLALGKSLHEAFVKAYACDPVSIFGGIVACNTTVDVATAEKLAELFLEIVAAPDFEAEALEILKKKKNLRIVQAPKPPREVYESTAIDGGLLVQSADRRLLESWNVVTKAVPAPEYISDMIFGMRVVTYVKSNAIVVVKDLAAIGIGGGQTNRIWAAEQALARSSKAADPAGKPARVLASDAFFPFPDVVEAAAAVGIKAIIQPGGSVNDKQSIEACDRLGIALVFTGTRHFKH